VSQVGKAWFLVPPGHPAILGLVRAEMELLRVLANAEATQRGTSAGTDDTLDLLSRASVVSQSYGSQGDGGR
jgi:hypothetical protein